MGRSAKKRKRIFFIVFVLGVVYAVYADLPTVWAHENSKPEVCAPNPEVDLTGEIQAGTGNATIRNSSRICDYEVGFASYKKFDENIENQELFDSEVITIEHKSTIKLYVGVPGCNYQIDLFYGELIESFKGGVRYGDRKLDSEHVNQGAYCVKPTPTPTPTPSPEPSPSPTPTPTPSPEPTPTPTPSALSSPSSGGGSISRASSGPRSVPTPQPTPGSAGECAYLKDFLRIDWNNDRVEVLKVQAFLNTFENISVPMTGIFDQDTFNAVVTFQERYFEDILAPWGHDAGTGFVYLTTRKKINEIYCNKSFPLTPEQLKEIDEFRAFLEQWKAGDPSPSDENGGVGDIEEEQPAGPADQETKPLPEEQVGLLDQGEERNDGDRFLGALIFSSPEELRRFLLYLLGIAGLMILWWLWERRRIKRLAV